MNMIKAAETMCHIRPKDSYIPSKFESLKFWLRVASTFSSDQRALKFITSEWETDGTPRPTEIDDLKELGVIFRKGVPANREQRRKARKGLL